MALARKLTSKIHEIKAHSEKVTCLDLGETGRVLVTGGRDRNVNLWAIGEEKCFMSLTGHNGSIDCVRFAYNDDYVYSADDIGIIRRWDLNAQTICSTLNGHMKSVRTLDFNPSGEYVVSGSNDTTVRMWDVRNQNKCIKTYKGHIANVNSVKFSPDGLWIASAGTEGSVIIWDIRKSKQIIQFTERASPVTCVQFHPYEFLLAAGRNDGSIYIYDLENKQLISKTDNSSPFSGHTIKCITFSETGECLFVGTAEGISVIGWEPDREFDHIESTWSILGDMKIVNRKLICGSFEKEYVSIHALSIDRVIPFYNPSNVPPVAFNHNHTTRKSFSRGNQKLRLSIGATKQEKLPEENEEHSPIVDGQLSPNLSIELVDDIEEQKQPAVPNGGSFDGYMAAKKINHYNFSPLSTHNYPKTRDYEGPSSLKTPGEPDIYHFNKFVDNFDNDLGYNPNDSNPPIISNYEEAELEDFPVNNAQQPDYAPKMDLGSTKSIVKHKLSSLQVQKKPNLVGVPPTKAGFQRKLSGVSSYSTMDLHKMEDNVLIKKQITAPSRIRRQDNGTQHTRESNSKTRNVTVQIVTKPPTRSRTSFDLRANTNSIPTPIPRTPSHSMDDSSEIQMLSSSHEQVYQELSNRHATLQLIRNSTKSHDIVGALKQAIKMSGRTVFVDLLGAILEKTSTWNLDMCLLLLPEIYELLQSQHKFHYSRACDTLRVILSNFLPIIQENVDPWSPAKCLGVDIPREERQRKCLDCQHWLLRIRNLPDDRHVGSTLTQLQNMLVDL